MTLARMSHLLLVPLFASAMNGQETTGRLQGRIIAESGGRIADISVAIAGPALQGARVLRADDRGYFIAQALPPGEYRVDIKAVGFREVVENGVIVRLGQLTSLGELVLPVAAVVLEPVVVTYDPAGIDPMSTEIASRIDVRMAEQLPIGRDYASILTLLPQANQSYYNRDGVNVAGSTGLENAYYVDGTNVTEGYRNSGGINLPYSFIDHIELKTGGYEAEFGRALGGISSVITRKGSNTRSFSVFSFYTASSLASNSARSSLDFTTGRFARYDAGVSFGGPVVRDRLWYFLAYDAATANEDVRMPGGPQVDHTHIDQFAGKLTWRADARTDVSATLVGDPNRRVIVGNSFWGALPIKTLANADPYLGYWNQGGVALTLAASRMIGSHLLVETSAARARFRDHTGPRTARGAADPLFMDFTTGQWSGGYGNAWDRTSKRTAVSLAGSYQAGPHLFKLGAQYEDNGLNENWRWASTGPDGAGSIMRSAPDGYLDLLLNLRTVVHNRIPTLFGQASILAQERVRINAGLRWEGQYFKSPTTGRSGSIKDQFQPRVGAIFYPTASHDQKITASYGRFYEQLPTEPVSWFWGGLHQQFFFYDHDPRVDPSGGTPFFWDDVPAASIKGQHFDEFTVGYERVLAHATTFALRGSHRSVKTILAGISRFDLSPPVAVLANPGRGEFDTLAKPLSHYGAVELSISRLAPSGVEFMVSYVLSRKFGNYIGLFDQDNGNPNAQAGSVTNATGLLPNDRKHALKALGSYRFGRPLALGAVFVAESGTPISELAARRDDPTNQYFVKPRGAAGRTPTLFDLDLRASYDFPAPMRLSGSARLVADFLHVLGQRRPLLLDQLHYLSTDASGNPIQPNPLYGSGLQFQPPRTFRLGIELRGQRYPEVPPSS
jgi:carboxypeptidase family protein